MATMMVCLCMGVVSCKDDDDDENNEREVGGETQMSDNANDDAAALLTLLKYVCEYEGESVDPTILNQTFEPTIGTIDDESQPTVRTVVAGTLADADAIAARMLGSLGISNSQPNGFQYSNDAIGTVSYQHASGSELATITFGVKQIPHLTKIAFTATAKDNASVTPYYHVGDVVKYKKKLYICVSSIGTGKPIVTWVHFDTTNDLEKKKVSTNTCKWLNTGNDIYYDGKMADRMALSDWMKNILFKDDVYTKLRNNLENSLFVSEEEIGEVMPSSDKQYKDLVEGCLIKSADSLVWEAWKPVKGETAPRYLLDRMNIEKGETSSSWEIKKYNVRGLMLCDLMRWSGVFSHDYWVPYICLIKKNQATALTDALDQTPAMTTLSPSHFRWETDGYITYKGEQYNIFIVAIHWTHEAYTLPDNANFKYYGLIDFTNHIPYQSEDYSVRNITSSWMSFTDPGKAKSGVEMVTSLNAKEWVSNK